MLPSAGAVLRGHQLARRSLYRSIKSSGMRKVGMKASVDDLVLQADRWRCTQLGIGVVSRNVVDVTVDVAKRYRLMLMLVASRRQIDTAALGGGYVCGWTAHDLAEHVTRRGGAEWIL